MPAPSPSKVLSLDQLLIERQRAHAAGHRVVQCHGCFDIVHPGHVRHLQFAAQQGDILLVSITDDPGVNKGDGRPLFDAALRAENLAALDCVDWVVINNHPTAQPLLSAVKPDIYIKGREYEDNQDPRFAAERNTVESHGGKIVFSSGDLVFSSSALIRALEQGEALGEAHNTDPRYASLQSLAASHDLSIETLADIIETMQGKHIAVAGELIIDEYIHCQPAGISSDAPCLSIRPIERRTYLGGAAVIARHLAALGARVTLTTALPDNQQAQRASHTLTAAGITIDAIHTDADIPCKQRFLVNAQKVVKVDEARDLAIDAATRDRMLNSITTLACTQTTSLPPCDATIIADFGLGLFTPRFVSRLADALRDRVGLLVGDVSGERATTLHSLTNADLVFPSESELRAVVGDHSSSLNAVASKLMEATGITAVCATLGRAGATLLQRRHDITAKDTGWHNWLAADHLPSMATHVVDELGCGDAMLATATLALAAGATRTQAAFLGSLAAAIHAERLGNDALSRTDLLKRLQAIASASLIVRRNTQPAAPAARIAS